MKHLILLQCRFFTYVREGRHDLLDSSLSEFKEATTAICYEPDVVWHDVHFSLSYVQDELEQLLKTVANEISSFIQQAISFLGRMIEHARLMIKHPLTSIARVDTSNANIIRIAKTGNLSKKKIVMLGHALHESHFKGSELGVGELCVHLGNFFGMKITAEYARSCFTDIRNDYRDGKTLFLENIYKLLVEKIERAIDSSDKLYDKKRRTQTI